jgi:hypothetical protein
LKAEMEGVRDFMFRKYASEVTALAYPYGVYNFEAVEAARAAGVRLAFTVNPGANDSTTDPLHLHRYLVVNGLSRERFSNFFDRRPLHVAKVEPADGEVIHVRNPVFRARILDEVDPSSVRMYLGDKPLKKEEYDSVTGNLIRPLNIKLRRGGHMVTISAVDKMGVTRTFSWYFRIKNPPRKKSASSAPPASFQMDIMGPPAPLSPLKASTLGAEGGQ